MKTYFKNIILTLILLIGVSFYASAQLRCSEVDINVKSDSSYTLLMKYDFLSNVPLENKHDTWAVFNGYLTNNYFWLGTSSVAVASGFYIAAAWSDPVVYVESHKHYNRDYYNKAIKKRNIKIIGGSVFTGLAVYFYSKIDRKKRVKWVIGPDGIKYKF